MREYHWHDEELGEVRLCVPDEPDGVVVLPSIVIQSKASRIIYDPEEERPWSRHYE